MSFNVRVGSANDGVNAWDNRKPYVAQTIEAFDPDVLGVQEALRYQANYITDNVPGYTRMGVSVNQDGTGEFTALYYRTSRLTRVRGGNFWLSPTPGEPSLGWDARNIRMVTWAELRDNENPGFSFVVMNTHWDHIGAEARFQSARLMRSKLTELAGDLPVIFTGDFNADQGGRAYQRMMGLDDADTVRDLVDSYRALHPGNSGTVGTAHGFDGTAGNGRIDWILHDEGFDTIRAAIDRTSFEGRYPSDHFPVTAVLRPIVAVPEPASIASMGAVLLLLRRRRR